MSEQFAQGEEVILGVKNGEAVKLGVTEADPGSVQNVDRGGLLNSERDSTLSKFKQAVSRLKERIKSRLAKIFRQNCRQPENQHDTDSQTEQNPQTATLQEQPDQESSSGSGQQPGRPKISRRRFLITSFTVGFGGLVALAGYRTQLARLLDKLLFSPEKLLEGVSLSNLLECILDSTPRVVEPPTGEISENFARNFAEKNAVKTIELSLNSSLEGGYTLYDPEEIFAKGVFLETLPNAQSSPLHQDTKTESEDPFIIGKSLNIVGFGIITDARGLWYGQQEYCVMLFDEENNCLAIGYEGGLYGYDFKHKEWRRLVNSDGQYLQVNPEWQGLGISLPKMSEQVISGLRLFQWLGYTPYPIVRGDVKMPEMNEKPGKFAPENFYSEKNQYGRYLLGQSGEVIDLAHAWGMVGKLVLAVMQMLEQYSNQIETSPGLNNVSFKVSIPHFEGDENFPFEYQCDLNVQGLKAADVTRAILLIGFLLIQATGFLMETVSQRAVKDIVPMPLPFVVGMTPEDMYSNSLGMWLALTELLSYPNPKEIIGLQDNENREKFLGEILENLASSFAISQPPIEEVKLQTLGMYPFVPVVDPEAFRAQGGKITNPFLNSDEESFQAILAELKKLLNKAQIKVTSIPYFAYNVKRADGGIR